MTATAQIHPLETGLLHYSGGPIDGILTAAGRCFRTSGYAAASIREIARAAGVSKSLLHYHFRSKEHLFLEVQVRTYNGLAARICESLDETGSPRTRALFALDTLFDTVRVNADLQVQAKVWARTLADESLLSHVRELRDRLRRDLIGLVEHVLGPALDDLPVTSGMAVDLLWALVCGLGLQASIDDDKRIEQAFDGIRLLVQRLVPTEARERTAS